jgi:hypothetical protein
MHANDRELRPVNQLGLRHGYWLIQPKIFEYTSYINGYTAHFVNGELFGYIEVFDVDYVVINKEYYAT